MLLSGALNGANAQSATKTLYAFCGSTACTDGAHPSGTLLIDSRHHLFGTTTRGGQNDAGTVFEIIQNQTTGSHRHKVIYDFCNLSGCTDGAQPIDGSLIMDTDGSLYGTTSVGGPTGGPNGGGVVFKLTPNAQKTRWTYSLVYNFCQLANCEDGITPIGNLTYFGAATGAAYDKTSKLYGTTMEGGHNNNGTVYSLEPKAGGGWKEVPLYFFCAVGGSSCSDGRAPTGGLTMDPIGNLAGTTAFGGIGDAGVAFKLTPTDQLRWSETVLHQFCSSQNCADGMSPRTGLVSDAIGNYYGATLAGGNANDLCGSAGCGVAFKIDVHGLFSQLYTFCGLDMCADGGAPARLTLDLDDNPIGLTAVGGLHKGGTLYKLSPTFQDLFDFKCKPNRCVYGGNPNGGVITDTDNSAYGVMNDGGSHQQGTVLKYTPPL
jgi:uncharacterized repeat protein (TIGR03803 family)